MGLFDGIKINQNKPKEKKLKPVIARWEVSLTVVCPICTTKIDMEKSEMEDIGVLKLLDTPDKLRSDCVECPMCNLPILIKEIQKKPKLRGSMSLEYDEPTQENDEEQELDFSKTKIGDVDPSMGMGEDDDWDYNDY